MDAVLGGKWGRSGLGILDGVEIGEGEGVVLRVNVGHTIVTNGDFVAWLFLAVRGGDAARPKLLWDFLFIFELYIVTMVCQRHWRIRRFDGLA